MSEEPSNRTPKNQFATFIVPEDASATAHCEALKVDIDGEGDVWLVQEKHKILLTYVQAHALVLNLSQKLISFDRAFGYRPRNSLKEVQ